MWNVSVVTPDGLHLHFTDEKAQRHGCRFFGDEGMVHVDRGRLEAEPESLLKVAFRPTDERLYESNNHHGNFLECIRTRRAPVSPVESGHAATTLTIVCDIATRLGRKVTWDWQAEKFIGDEAANHAKNYVAANARGSELIQVPQMPEDYSAPDTSAVLYMDPKNVRVGIHRKMKLRVAPDVRADSVVFVVSMRVGFKFKHEDEVVKLYNVGVTT